MAGWTDFPRRFNGLSVQSPFFFSLEDAEQFIEDEIHKNDPPNVVKEYK